MLDSFPESQSMREEARLAALRRYHILDTPPEEGFDDLTRLAAQICGTPISFVALIDAERQWYKSCYGYALTEIPRELAFCRFALESPDLLIVPDMPLDPRFASHPQVAGAPFVRFYAGAPLVTSDGHILGTLCVLDTQSHSLSSEQQDALRSLGRQVVGQLELRRRLADLEHAEDASRTAKQELENSVRQMRGVTDNVPALIARLDAQYRYVFSNRAYQQVSGVKPADMIGRTVAQVFGRAMFEKQRPTYERILAGESVTCEVNVPFPTGTRFMQVSYVPERDPSGAVSGITLSAIDISARRRAEEDVRRAEEKYRSIFENAVEGIFQSIPGGGFLNVNPALARILGYDSPEEVLASISDLGTQVYAKEEERAEMQRLFATDGVVYGHELEVLRKDKTTIWASLTARAVRDTATGGILYIEGSAVDITARRRAEERTRQLADVVNYSNEAIISKTIDDMILSWNPGAERLYGYRADEAVGRRFADLVPPDRTSSGPSLTQRLLAGEHISHVEMARQDRYGRRVEVSVSLSPIRDAHGQIRAVSSIASDITSRKNAEAAQRESELRFRSAFDDAPIGMCLSDAEGRHLEINRALCQFVGYSESELIADGFSVITHPDDVEPDLCQYEQLLNGHINTYTMEKRYFHRDGHTVWANLSVSAIRDAKNSLLYVIAQVQDITQQRTLENEREHLLVQTEALLHEAIERADRDPLTGLWNHRAFHRQLDKECAVAEESGSTVAVVMIDLDNFKFFNDAYGHPAGDDVLRRVADELTRCAGPGDTVARFGGDEFALLLPGLDAATAQRVVDLASANLEEAGYRPDGYNTTIPLGLSAGIAVWPHDHTSRQEVVEHADERLRLCKSGAKDLGADDLRTRMGRSLEGFSMLDALVTSVDNKDRYTRRHSEDVLMYCLQIAEELGMDEKSRQTLSVAALLHDVGKIGVPDKVLRKPGKLTDEEFAAIQHHPMMGAIIVGAVPGLEETLDAVRHHHERWDGGGYPFGLRGEETPLMARLMAVADAFSAMTTDRPYRKGMSHDKALKILRDGAGSQWDPICVQAFLNAQRPGLAIAA